MTFQEIILLSGTHFKEKQYAAGVGKGFLVLLDVKPEDSR